MRRARIPHAGRHIPNGRNLHRIAAVFFFLQAIVFPVSAFADSLESGNFMGFRVRKAFHDWRKHW